MLIAKVDILHNSSLISAGEPLPEQDFTPEQRAELIAKGQAEEG